MKISKGVFVLLKKTAITLAVLVPLCGVMYLYFKTPAFTITSYELVGVPEQYKDTVVAGLKNISQNYAYKIFPGSRVFTYRKASIQSFVVETLPNTEMVTIRPVGIHTLRVTVKQFVPLFKIDDTHGVTKEGVIYSEFKDLSAYPVLVIASSTFTNTNQGVIASRQIKGLHPSELSSIAGLLAKIDAVIFKVSKVEIDENRDVYLYASTSKSSIKFAEKQDYAKVWSNIVSAIDTEPLKTKLATKKDMLEYIDARFGNKVFYKFTGDIVENGQKGLQENYEIKTATTTPLH
jgi:hypothetical protein